MSSRPKPLSEPSSPAADSIETILEIEKEDREELAPANRFFHALGAFFGTVYFIVFQCAIVASWIGLNSVASLRSWAIDPFPFPLLATFLSLEAVLLTSCVLIRQNAMDRTSERRDNLELQINLLAEKEATRSLDMLHRIGKHLQIPKLGDHQSIELAKETPIDEIARDLKEREKAAETEK
jgi:uncharacterized membrane protein